jgi:hypothetical protein
MRFIFAALFFVVGCRSSFDDLCSGGCCQSPAVGFVVPLSDDGLVLLWVRNGNVLRPGDLVASVVKLNGNKWFGGAPVKLGRGLSAEALRSNSSLNLQMDVRGETDYSHEINLAKNSDARRGFMLPSSLTLVKLVPSDDCNGSFMIVAYALTKVGDQTMVLALNSDVLSFRRGRFVP